MRPFLIALLLWSSPSLAEDPPADPGDSAGSDAPTEPDVVVEELEAERGHRCQRLIGVAGGVFERGQSWDFGRLPVALAGSPTLGMVCDFDVGIPISLGADFMPLYRTRRFNSSIGHPVWMTLVFGALPHDQGKLAIGPVATISWMRVGGGARLQYLAFGDEERPRGVEARLQAFYNGGLEVQLMLAYVFQSKRFVQ